MIDWELYKPALGVEMLLLLFAFGILLYSKSKYVIPIGIIALGGMSATVLYEIYNIDQKVFDIIILITSFMFAFNIKGSEMVILNISKTNKKIIFTIVIGLFVFYILSFLLTSIYYISMLYSWGILILSIVIMIMGDMKV